MMNVNKAIADYLKERGIKQTFLAKQTGFNVKTINAIVNDKRKVSAEDLGKISSALNVSADIFLHSCSLE